MTTKALQGRVTLATPPDPSGGGGTDWQPYTPVWYENGSPNAEGSGVLTGEYLDITNPDGSHTVDVKVELHCEDDRANAGGPLSVSYPEGLPLPKSAAGAVFASYTGTGTEYTAIGMGICVITDAATAPVPPTGRIELFDAYSGDYMQEGSPIAFASGAIVVVSIRYHTGAGVCETFTDQDEDVLNVSQPYVPGSTSVRSTSTGDSGDPLDVTWTEGSGPQEYDETDPSTGEITLFGSRPTPTGRVVVCYTPA